MRMIPVNANDMDRTSSTAANKSNPPALWPDLRLRRSSRSSSPPNDEADNSTVKVRRILCGYEICGCYGVYENWRKSGQGNCNRGKSALTMGIDYTSLAARRKTWERGRSVFGEFEGEWNDDVTCELDTPSCVHVWNE
jgi:hypothetical protein